VRPWRAWCRHHRPRAAKRPPNGSCGRLRALRPSAASRRDRIRLPNLRVRNASGFPHPVRARASFGSSTRTRANSKGRPFGFETCERGSCRKLTSPLKPRTENMFRPSLPRRRIRVASDPPPALQSAQAFDFVAVLDAAWRPQRPAPSIVDRFSHATWPHSVSTGKYRATAPL
jgi:hypothetical protein